MNSGTRPAGFTVAVPTMLLHPTDSICVSVNLLVIGSLPYEHAYSLSLPEAAALERSLVEAPAAREAAGSSNADIECATGSTQPLLQFTMPDDSEPGVYCVLPAEARALGNALGEALRVLVETPPQEEIREVGSMDVATTDGAKHRIEVYVTMMVPIEGDRRIKFECPTGTWTIDDDVPALASALEEAAGAANVGTILAVDPPASESLQEPWLTVTVRPDWRIALRLYDDMVQHDAGDGVLLFAPEEARGMASILRAALAFCAATPARLTVPPEPFERVVATGAW